VQPFSVVVPAYNEEAAIERCLRAIVAGAAPGEVDVVVVCNGCTDGTAARARRVAHDQPGIRVLELPQASKVAALRAGDAAADHLPRCFVDADVAIDIWSLRMLVEAGAPYAVPRAMRDLADASWPVRSFYRLWTALPFAAGLESGVYALSAEGRARVGDFPDVVADDQFVLESFAPQERLVVTRATSRVRPPQDLRGLLHVRTRVRLGNRLLREAGLGRGGGERPWATVAQAVAARPALVLDLPVYLGVTGLAEWRARRARRQGDERWQRDESSRPSAVTT